MRRIEKALVMANGDGDLGDGISQATPRALAFDQTGQVVPFFAPSRPLAYPLVPVDGTRNQLSVFRMRCATIASCWRRLLSLNQ